MAEGYKFATLRVELHTLRGYTSGIPPWAVQWSLSSYQCLRVDGEAFKEVEMKWLAFSEPKAAQKAFILLQEEILS